MQGGDPRIVYYVAAPFLIFKDKLQASIDSDVEQDQKDHHDDEPEVTNGATPQLYIL